MIINYACNIRAAINFKNARSPFMIGSDMKIGQNLLIIQLSWSFMRNSHEYVKLPLL